MQSLSEHIPGDPRQINSGGLLISDSTEFQEYIFKAIDAAKSEILLEYYIFEPDDFGEKLLEKIEAVSTSGVKVQAVFDGYGSLDFLNKHHQALTSSQIQVRIYHPLPWSSGYIKQLWKLPKAWLNYFLTLDRRNHRKLLIVDNRYVVLGSQNISIRCLEWFETSLFLTLDTAEAFRESFRKVWAISTPLNRASKRTWRGFSKKLQFRKRHKTPSSGEFGVLDNTTLPKSLRRTRTILSLIAKAETRIWITTPYFYPHRSFLRHLKRASRRGVDVRFILPWISDVKFSQWISHALYDELLKADIKLFQFRDGLLHAKLLTVDNQYILGSGNFNHRSFFQDLELDLVGSDESLLKDITALQCDYMSRSDSVTGINKVHFKGLKILLAKLTDPFKRNF